ncbi:maternal protein tudor-like isoform X2 [Haliotis asinina]|uniref:maternal protein tudor-like isoform X2 n=1 Tax=Haliotis asinina TaxID=109174 RepID=UPI003531F8EF
MSRFSQGALSTDMMKSPPEFKEVEITPGTQEEVFVSHITDPEHFCVQLTRWSGDLDRLMDDLHEEYSTLEGSAGTMRPPVLGNACVAQFSEDEGWYRAVITGVLKSGMVEVRFIDYGNSECMSAEKVKEIQPAYLALPPMAVCCGLTGVTCTQGYWPPEFTAQFEDLALDQTLTATFRGVKPERGILSVELVSPSGKSINVDFGASTNTACIEEASLGSTRKIHIGQGDADMTVTLNSHGTPAAALVGAEGASSQVSNLPTVDLSSGQNEVVVVYAYSPGRFWCQLVNCTERLDHLSTQLNREYNQLGPADDLGVLTATEGMLCAARFSEDMQWYRGVVQTADRDEIEVYFIDYGNTERIPLRSVKDLKPVFRSEPAQAIKCMLSNLKSGSQEWSDASAEMFESLTLDKHLMAVQDGRTVNGSIPVRLKDPVQSFDIAEKMAEASHGTLIKSNIPRVPVHMSKQPTFPRPNVTLTSQAEVFVSWVENPEVFWVQLSSSQLQLENLVEKVQGIYSTEAAPIRSILPGMAVVAQYSEDDAWYRALVTKMRGKKVDILFVDFGNSDTVNADALKEVSPHIINTPMQAIQCSLSGVCPLTSSWTEDTKSVLEDITKDGALCTFLSQQNGSYTVKLEVNGCDVGAEIVSAGVAKQIQESTSELQKSSQAILESPLSVMLKFTNSLSLHVSQTETGFVSHIDSLASFWFQPSNNSPDLDRLMKDLEGFYSQGNGIQLPNPQPAMAAVAKYSEDLSWYRAQVQHVDKSGVSVLFVDYGNSELASPCNVCAIGSQFLTLPMQAVHCKLALSCSLGAEVDDTFHDLVTEKEVQLTVTAVHGGTHVVDVLLSGQSITDTLKKMFPALQVTSPKSVGLSASGRLDYKAPIRPTGKTQQVFVCLAESPGQFYVHLSDIDGQLQAVMEQLTNIYSDGAGTPLDQPQCGQPCCAQYSEDGEWYRGKVMSVQGNNVTVLFVDYGNSDVVKGEDVKMLSPTMLSPGPFALECALEHADPVTQEWTDDAIAYFETLTAEKEITCTFKQGKDVSLIVDGVDVLQKLQEKGFVKVSMNGPESSELSLIYNPQTVPSQPNAAYVTHVEENGVFYVQLSSAEDLVSELSERLQELYTSDSASPLTSIVKGMPCCAKFTDDEAWYRAVIECVRDGNISVRFVDFGNCDIISKESVKSLEVDFFTVPPLAFECRLQGVATWQGNQKQMFSEVTEDKELTVRFITKTTPYTVELSHGSLNIIKHLMPDLTSPSRSTGFYPSPTRTDHPSPKSFSPPSLHNSPKTMQSPKKSFGSPSSNVHTERKPFGSPPQREEPHKLARSFGSPPSRQESWGNQRKSFGSPPEKATPILENIPVVDQVYGAQTVPGEPVLTCISHVEGSDIYLQQTKDLNTILSFSNKIDNLPTNTVSPAVGLACGALFSDDDTWYRACVTKVEDDKVSVVFVDFGNSDIVASTKLKQLSRELLGVAPMAYCCRLNGIRILTSELQNVLAEEAATEELSTKFISEEIPYTVVMKTPVGKDLTEILIPTQPPAQEVPSQLQPGVVSNISLDGTFFVQLLKDEADLRKIEEELKLVYAKGTINQLDTLQNGQPCCARFPGDHSWQRGMVKGVHGSSVQVDFFDLGVAKEVNSAYVQPIPRKFMLCAPYAYQCILKDFTSWTDEQRHKFTSMTNGKTMNVQFLSQTAPYKVELTRSVGLDLLEEKAALQRESVTSSTDAPPPSHSYPAQDVTGTCSAFLSYMEEDGSFYLQLAREEESLTQLTEALQAEYTESGGERIFGLKPGMVCCAKFTEDDQWYRAVVESVAEEQVTVRFVDYGNTDVATMERLAVLTPNNMSAHPLAYHCTLDGVESWSQCLIDKFDEAVKEKKLEVTFKTSAPLFSVVVKLEDGENVLQLLQEEIAEAANTDGFRHKKLVPGERVQVFVSHVDTVLNFWVQMVTSERDLAELSAAISEGYETPQDSQDWLKVGCAVIALYAEDGQWYRGSVKTVGEETCRVQFVDYGNSDEVAKANIYAIKHEHLKLPVQAASCKLCNLAVVEGKEDAAMDTLFEVTNEKTLSLEVVQKLRDEDVRYSVQLYDGDVDVKKKLFDDGLCCVVEKADVSLVEGTDVSQVDSKAVESHVMDSNVSAVPSDSSQMFADIEELDTVPNPYSLIELKEGQRSAVRVIHAVTPSELYIRPDSMKHSVDDLMENMFEFYNDLAEGDMVLEAPEPGQMCACRCSGDSEAWCRGKVCWQKGGQCKVFCVDFGTSETVACSAVRKLPEQFQTLPAQSVLCTLAGVCPTEGVWSQAAIELFRELTADKTLIMDILTLRENGSCIVHLLHMGLAVNQVMLQKNVGVDAATPVAVSHKVKRIFSDSLDTPVKLVLETEAENLPETQIGGKPVEEVIKTTTLNVGEEYEVTASHIESPGQFFCQLLSSVANLNLIAEQLQTASTETREVVNQEHLAVGRVGMARIGDECFRGRLMTVGESDCDVQLVDWGRIETIPESDFLVLPLDLTQLPCQAFRCCLTDITCAGRDWSLKSCSRFQELVKDTKLVARVISNLDSCCMEVDLLSDQKSVGQTLVQEQLAEIKEDEEHVILQRIEAFIDPFPITELHDASDKNIITAEREDGFLYLKLGTEKDYSIELGQDSILDKFVLDLTEVTKQVEVMMEGVQKYINSDEATQGDGDWEPTCDKPCLVEKHGENMWYRGKMVAMEDTVYKVYLVDYRETLSCERGRIRRLPPQFLKVPVNGFECQLADVAPVDGAWSQEAITHFHDMASDSVLAAFLVSQSEEGVHYVRLHDSEDLGSATVNRQLVDLGCALPLPGSLVEMELEMEEANADTMEEMEQSFNDVSYHRENSLGEDSDSDQADDSRDLGLTFNTTGHSMLDQTANTTYEQDTTLELVGGSILDSDRDTVTPKPGHSDDSALLCGEIMGQLLDRSRDIAEAAGHDICQAIVEDLVTQSEACHEESETCDKSEADAVKTQFEDNSEGDKEEVDKAESEQLQQQQKPEEDAGQASEGQGTQSEEDTVGEETPESDSALRNGDMLKANCLEERTECDSAQARNGGVEVAEDCPGEEEFSDAEDGRAEDVVQRTAAEGDSTAECDKDRDTAARKLLAAEEDH